MWKWGRPDLKGFALLNIDLPGRPIVGEDCMVNARMTSAKRRSASTRQDILGMATPGDDTILTLPGVPPFALAGGASNKDSPSSAVRRLEREAADRFTRSTRPGPTSLVRSLRHRLQG
jgi:hypothetical protein